MIEPDGAATQLDVMILGREYRIACRAEEREELLRAVAHLDTRMREIRDTGRVSGIDRIAVMAALNIAHDLLRERGAFKASGSAEGAGSVDAPDAQRRIRRMQQSIDQALDHQDKLF